MTEATYDPPGIDFFDAASRRQMKLVTHGHTAGWIVYRHPDGHWVTLRKATDRDKASIKAATAIIRSQFADLRIVMLAAVPQKGEPMAQTDSDTLAKRMDEHDIQHDAVQKHLASLEDQIAELSKQQADSHAAILNALQQLSQPSPTASPAAQPTTTKE